MDIESAPGRGTRVTVAAPTRAGAAPAPGPGSAAAGASTRSPAAAPAGPDDRRPVRVLLADDHAIMRDGLAGLLRDLPGVVVVGEAADGLEAVKLVRSLRPDVVVMDVSMPRLSGLEATRLIAAELPGVRIIGLSMHEASDMEDKMRAAGATAYINKNNAAQELLAALPVPAVASPAPSS